MKGYIYLYTNLHNNKKYVGQTQDLVNRKSSHKLKAFKDTTNNKFYNAVKKYGWEAFSYEVLVTVSANSKEELTIKLDDLEVFYIDKYDSYLNGYNSTPGGHSFRGVTRSKEFKEKCRNRKYSKETRLKMSESAKNKKVSLETREKHRKNAIDRNFSQYRNKYSDKLAVNRRLSRIKPILQISPNGEILKEWDSIIEACMFIQKYIDPNLTISGITNAIIRHCKGITKKRLYKGFVWMYKSSTN